MKNSIIHNYGFLLANIWKAAPFKIMAEFGIKIASSLVTAYSSIWFVHYIVRCIERGERFREALVVLFVFLAVHMILAVFTQWYQCCRKCREDVRVKEYLSHRLYRQAAGTKLSLFEDAGFYDQYKRAADCIDKTVDLGFANLTGMAGFFAMLAATMYQLLDIDPHIWIFGLSGILVFFVTRSYNTRLYEEEKELSALARRQEYIKRTMLFKEYAKEIRLTKIYHVLSGYFENVVLDKLRVIRRHGVMLAGLYFLRDITGVEMIYIMVLGYACWRLVIKNDLSAAEFSVMCTAAVMINTRIRRLMEGIEKARFYGMRIFDLRKFFDYGHEPLEKGGCPEAFESLRAENVAFSYTDEKTVLKNISFEIRKGEKIAIVGENGSGKSTLVKLLLGLYDVSRGELLWNGKNIKVYDPAAYRKNFAVVLQDFKIFGVSTAENILERRAARGEERKVRDILKYVGMDRRVDRLSEGMHTVLMREFDPNGEGLSGGEKQKLAIARMIARDAPVVILDEPSSALDPIAEQEVFQSMFQACKDKTVLFITHRMSIAKQADQIIVLHRGQIAEEGKHEELLERKGVYSAMFMAQKEQYQGGADETI